MRTAISVLVLSTLASCGANSPSSSSGGDSVPATASPTPTGPTATPAPTPEITGDAATNKACTLLSVSEVESITGRHVRDILGTTSPGAYSGTFLSCTWHLEQTDIQSPAVVVQYETSPHDISGPLAYERSLIAQKLATGVPGIGDVAVLQPPTGLTVDSIIGRTMFHVRVQLHDVATGTAAQQQLAVTTAKLIVSRLPH